MENSTSPNLPKKEPLSLPSATVVDFTDPAASARFISGIASAFIDTRLSIAFIAEIDDTPPPYPSPLIDHARMSRHLTPGITNAAQDNAILLEAGGFSALAVWETTTYSGQPFTNQVLIDIGPIRGFWRKRVNELKAQYLGTKVDEQGTKVLNPHYHLGFLVRNPEVPHVPGAISAVVKPMLREAVKEGVPVWLEATYEHAVDVYLSFGFRVVEVVMVGQGKRNRLGWPEDGGSGVKAWMMIYDGHLRGDAETKMDL